MRHTLFSTLLILIFLLPSLSGEVIFFQRHYARRGSYHDTPRTGEKVGVLHLFAAPGEYEPVQLLLRSNQPEQNLEISLDGNLQGTASFIPVDAVDIRIVADQKHWLDPRRFERLPYLLQPNHPFRPVPNETARIWLTVKVPQDAAPGLYQTFVKVVQNGKTIQRIPLELTVWPFTLLPLSGNDISYSAFYGTRLPEWAKNETYLTRVLGDMKEHGFNSFVCQSQFTPDAAVKAIRDSNFASPGGKFIWTGAVNAWKEELERIEKLIADTGMELLCYGVDEPNTDERYQLQRDVSSRIRRDLPSAKMITAVFTGTIDHIADTLDIWMVEGIDLNDAMKAKADDAGKTLYTYECRLSPVDPLNSRHYWGVMLWRTGAKGASIWTYGGDTIGQITDRSETPVIEWTKFDPELQYRWEYVFCTPDILTPSIGYEGLREGIDDYRYLHTLTYWIAQARENGDIALADEGDALLAKIRNQINPDRYRQAFDQVYKDKQKGRNGEVGANFNRPAPETLQPEDYDAIRHQIARMIVKITEKLQSKQP